MISDQHSPNPLVDVGGLLENEHANEQQFIIARSKETYCSLACQGNQGIDDPALNLEKESNKKLVQNKLKYKKLKQKLNVLSEQIQDQGLLKDQKDITSPNKSRLMKLALQIEKSLKTQAIEYQLVESLLREIQKILEFRRQHDILILRGARLMSSLLAIIKRFPSLHKNEALQSMLALELSLKLMRIMLTLGSSRESLLVSNQVTAIISLLSCALMRQERRIAVNSLILLNLVLGGPNRIELRPLVNTNIEYILCSSLLKRLKSYLQICIFQDDPSHAEFLLFAFKFYYFIIFTSCQNHFQKPIYQSQIGTDSLSEAVSAYFQSGIQLLTQSVNDLIYEKECEGQQRYLYKQEQIPNFKISIFLFIFKTLNTIFYVDLDFTQQTIGSNKFFLNTLLFLFEYAKENFKENAQTRSLCSEIIVFIGNLAFQSNANQQIIRTIGLLESLCNHPLQYIMEPELRNILVPTFCCVIYENSLNFKKAFSENSVQPILQYINKQISLLNEKHYEQEVSPFSGKNLYCRTLSRKTSVSSINSSYSKASMAESYSTQASCNSIGRQIRFEHRFPPQYWQPLAQELRKIDD